MRQRQQQIMNNYWQKGTQNGTKTATNNEQLPIGKREHRMGLRLQQIMYKYGQKGTQNGTKTATNNEQILALGSKK